MSVLICGGAGYIGSQANKLFSQKGYDTIVFDNFVYGHKEFVKWGKLIKGDLSDPQAINRVFEENNIEAVLHFAAYAYVGESMQEPAKYYNNNVCCTIRLLDAMRRHGCNKIIFSSTCATYGIPERMPITEDMPQNPINPYGRTKWMVEQILKDYAAAYGIKFAVLRYFNAAGADPDGEIGEWHVPETHLIPIVLDAASGVRPNVKIFGTDYPTPDGTCVRDYIHVYDLATAHLLALEYLQKGGESDFFNLGNALGTSVLDVIQAAKDVTGCDFEVENTERRAGDPPILVGSSEKASKVLGWRPVYGDIHTIVSHAWTWYQKLQRSIRHE